MNRKKRVLFAVILAVVLAGCGTTTVNVKPQTEWTPKEWGIYFSKTYTAHLHDAQQMGVLAQAGKLSPGQVTVYRQKRLLLIKAEPLVKGYNDILSAGGIPGPEKQGEILNILNELAALAAGG
jgi:hypothetical protein